MSEASARCLGAADAASKSKAAAVEWRPGMRDQAWNAAAVVAEPEREAPAHPDRRGHTLVARPPLARAIRAGARLRRRQRSVSSPIGTPGQTTSRPSCRSVARPAATLSQLPVAPKPPSRGPTTRHQKADCHACAVCRMDADDLDGPAPKERSLGASVFQTSQAPSRSPTDGAHHAPPLARQGSPAASGPASRSCFEAGSLINPMLQSVGSDVSGPDCAAHHASTSRSVVTLSRSEIQPNMRLAAQISAVWSETDGSN